MKRRNLYDVPVWHKTLLSVDEAAEMSGLGRDKIYNIIHENIGADFVIEIGAQYKLKRVLFEEFLLNSTTLGTKV